MCTNAMASVLLGRARSCVSLPVVLSPLVAAWFAQSELRWGLRWEVPKPSHSGGDLSSAMPVSPAAVKKHSLQVRILLRYRKNPRYWATG